MVGTLAGKGEPFAVATVVRTEGSSLAKPGFKIIVSKEGEVVFGSLGGVCPEPAIASTARQTLKTGTPKVVKVFLENTERAVSGVVASESDDEIHVETNCGGTMDVYIEPFLPRQRLILIGQGGKDDIEDSLVGLGQSLGFEVVVIDHSPVLSGRPDRLITDADFDLSSFGFVDSDSVVVLTRGGRDVEVLRSLAGSGVRFVGLLASSQRAKEDLERLRATGVDGRFLESIRSPVGLDIGAVTPAEIALSIVSEVVAERHGKRVAAKRIGQLPT